jgi:hypothetical protein
MVSSHVYACVYMFIIVFVLVLVHVLELALALSSSLWRGVVTWPRGSLASPPDLVFCTHCRFVRDGGGRGSFVSLLSCIPVSGHLQLGLVRCTVRRRQPHLLLPEGNRFQGPTTAFRLGNGPHSADRQQCRGGCRR